MGVSRCRVSFTDMEGIPHSVEVQAESLYEAVAEFRSDNLTSAPGPMPEFTIAIPRPAVEHHIKLGQVLHWAQRTVKEGLRMDSLSHSFLQAAEKLAADVILFYIFHCFHHFYVGKVDSRYFSNSQRYLFALRDTLRPRLTSQELRPRGFACAPDCKPRRRT